MTKLSRDWFCSHLFYLHMYFLNSSLIRFPLNSWPLMLYYRPQRSWGQGYVFTRVCDSIHRGGCLAPPVNRITDTSKNITLATTSLWPPPDTLPGADTPTPREQTPPRKQTPAYGQWAAGTHPTGMHSCVFVVILNASVLHDYNVASSLHPDAREIRHV